MIGAAVFYYPGKDYLLVGLMLFLPFLDRGWQAPKPLAHRRHALISIGVLAAAVALLVWRPSFLSFAVSTLLLAAIPEEWFFRGYFMVRLGNGFPANLATSVLFSLLHGLSRGWPTAMLVFAPSLFYGWLYQRTRDLPLLILIHGLSNLFFALFLARLTMMFPPDLR